MKILQNLKNAVKQALNIHVVSHRNLLNEKRNGYEVRMCANCGHEEEMHFMERWCKRCRGDYDD